MAHNHGNEYQLKIVYEDETEELSEWMNSEAQLAQAIAAVPRPKGNAYWLRERNVVCPSCLDREQRILEYPLADFRVNEAAHTTPTICWQWGTRTGTSLDGDSGEADYYFFRKDE